MSIIFSRLTEPGDDRGCRSVRWVMSVWVRPSRTLARSSKAEDSYTYIHVYCILVHTYKYMCVFCLKWTYKQPPKES